MPKSQSESDLPWSLLRHCRTWSHGQNTASTAGPTGFSEQKSMADRRQCCYPYWYHMWRSYTFRPLLTLLGQCLVSTDTPGVGRFKYHSKQSHSAWIWGTGHDYTTGSLPWAYGKITTIAHQQNFKCRLTYWTDFDNGTSQQANLHTAYT